MADQCTCPRGTQIDLEICSSMYCIVCHGCGFRGPQKGSIEKAKNAFFQVAERVKPTVAPDSECSVCARLRRERDTAARLWNTRPPAVPVEALRELLSDSFSGEDELRGRISELIDYAREDT